MSTNKTLLTIDDKARSYARIYSSLISDQYQRKRANAAIMMLFAYASFLKRTTDLKVQNSMTMYRTPFLCEQFELADFYVNNYHIDVRVTTDDTSVLIPKIHYDNNIIPDFYAVVSVDLRLKKAELSGIIDTSKESPEPFDYHYYKFDLSKLISNEAFLDRIKNVKSIDFDDAEHDNFQEKYLSFIDNEIGAQGKIEILKHLFTCPECRTEFCCFTGFEMVSCRAANYPEIFNDSTLDFIGAQIADDKKYAGKEETIYFDEDENKHSVTSKSANQVQQEINKEEKDVQEQETEQVQEASKVQEVNASSIMSEEDYSNDETKMDFVPDLSPVHKDSEAASKISEENSDDDNLLDELFSDDETEQAEMQVISDDDTSDTIVEKDDLNENIEKQKASEKNYDYENDKNVQKVIIDYDENGNPIYSYIANADGTGPVSELEKDNVKNEESTKNKSDDIEFDLSDLLDSDDERDEKKENDIESQVIVEEVPNDILKSDDEDVITEVKSENDEKNDNVISAESSSSDTTTGGIDELDILDQMFVDGALEREAKEQQEMSYTPLGTPVDSHIANEDEGPDTLPEPKDESENSQTEAANEDENSNIDNNKADVENDVIKDDSSDIINDEIKEEIAGEKTSILTEEIKFEEYSQTDEIKPLNEEDENNKDMFGASETEELSLTEENNSKETVREEKTDFTVSFIEDDVQISDKTEDNKSETVDEDMDASEKNDDLLKVLPSESDNASVPIFDEYIETGLSENNADGDSLINLENEEDNTDENSEENEEYDEDEDENEGSNADDGDDDEDDEGEYEEDDDDDDDDDDEGEDDMNDENSQKSSLNKILIIIVIIAALLIICGISAFFFIKNKNTFSIEKFDADKEIASGEVINNQANDLFEVQNNDSEIIVPNESNNGSIEISGETIKTIPLKSSNDIEIGSEYQPEENLPVIKADVIPLKKYEENKAERNSVNGDINKAITKALSANKNLITLRGVNWKCEAELFSDRAFKKYLQNIDNTLKQNLKGNIMGVTEVPPKNQVITKFAVDNNRNLRKVIITQSSGSSEVDEIVLRSINETFEGEKSPILTDSPLKSAMYFFEVVIKL